MARKKVEMKQLKKKPAEIIKKKRSAKLFILAVTAVFTLSVLAIGLLSTTQATFKDSDNKNNDFSYGDLKVDLVEEFEPNENIIIGGAAYEKKVSVKNSGEVDTFIRVLVLPEILFNVGESEAPVLLPSLIGKELNLLDDKDLPITNTNDWQDGQDGYYYYLKKLEPGETTATLFESAKVSTNLITKDSLYENSTLNIYVKVEGIHTTQFAYRDAWWQGKMMTDGGVASVDEELKKLSH